MQVTVHHLTQMSDIPMKSMHFMQTLRAENIGSLVRRDMAQSVLSGGHPYLQYFPVARIEADTPEDAVKKTFTQDNLPWWKKPDVEFIPAPLPPRDTLVADVLLIEEGDQKSWYVITSLDPIF